MTNDIIIVEVGRPEFGEAIKKIAFEQGFEWAYQGSGPELSSDSDTYILHFNKEDKDILWSRCLDEGSDYTLPDDWYDVVEWLEESEEPFTFKGYEVDVMPMVDGAVKVKIGCSTVNLGDLDRAIDFVNRFNIEQFSISTGASSSLPVTRDELIELHKEVRKEL